MPSPRPAPFASIRPRPPVALAALLALVLAAAIARTAGAAPWMWDQDQDGLDDRLAAVADSGLDLAYENADPGGLLRFEVAEAGSLLTYGAYVRFVSLPTASDSTALALAGAQVVTRFRSVPYIRVRAPYSSLVLIAGNPRVERVEAATLAYKMNFREGRALGVRRGKGDPYPTLEQGPGLTGAGTVVAILDTGINDAPMGLYSGNADLAGKVAGGADYGGLGPAGYTPWTNSVNPDQGTVGLNGYHATHVAGTVAGATRARTLGGIAPGARLVDVKVLNDQGVGYGLAEGLQWCLENRTRAWPGGGTGIDVVNLSVSGTDASDGTDCVCALVDTLAARGVIVVASAGNHADCGALSAPAAADGAITVGAADVSGPVPVLAPFGAAGPRPDDHDLDHADEMKPDLTAPGVGVVSDWGSPLSGGHGYQTASGTSQAAAFVSGVCALLREAAPGIAPGAVKTLLHDTAAHRADDGPACAETDPFGLDARYHTGWGWGELDAMAAYLELVHPGRTQFVRVGAAWNEAAARVDFTWTTQLEAGLTGFTVQAAPDAGGAPGAFAAIPGSPVPAAGYSDLTGGNRTAYALGVPGAGLPAGSPVWLRVISAGGAGGDTSAAIAVVPEAPVATVTFSFRHNTPETDLALSVGSGLDPDAADLALPVDLAAGLDSVWVSLLWPGSEEVRYTVSLPVYGAAGLLPPSTAHPWWLRAIEGGDPARSGALEGFSLTVGGVPYPTDTPTPALTQEGGSVALWVPTAAATGLLPDAGTAPAAALRAFPNPFRGSQAITVRLSGRERVELTVLDVTGRAVRRLFAGSLGAGEHAFRWDGRDDRGRPEASGRYYLRLRREAGQSVAAVALLR